MAEIIIPPIDEYTAITTLDIALLFISLTFWILTYRRALHNNPSSSTDKKHANKNANFDTPFISNLHSIPLCILAFLSLQQIIPETAPLCWSTSFFLVDLYDATVRREWVWMVHAIISLALNLCTGCTARHRVLRSVSKGFFAEASTPLLNYWKKSKSYQSFLTFFLAFTACRMIWVPYFIYNTYAITLNGQIDFLIWPSSLFYILQIAWYVKMCLMVVNYKEHKESNKDGLKKEK